MLRRTCVATTAQLLKTCRILASPAECRNAVCTTCILQQRLAFHTSSFYQASKAKNTKRKIVRPVVFTPKDSSKVIPIRHNMTVAELAEALGNSEEIDSFQVIKEIVKKSGFKFRMDEVKKKKEKESKDATRRPPPDPKHLKKRPPVVTIMGHVDHGKTTLLDALRHSHIVDQEFGGITQHIGAFIVNLDSGEQITFLDTPGHAAFSNMRSRGAHITDIVVLVVAADDGVMRQTEESIRMAQDAAVPMIIALNKIDKHDADPERAKQMLVQHGIQLEEYGGETQLVPVSALKGTNLKALQEAIVTLAELLEVKGDPTGLVEGTIIESSTHPGRGKLATVLVQRGTLRKGQILVAGSAWAKVRSMFSDRGDIMKEAGPGIAVEIIGWKELPSAGELILEVESEKRAHEVISWRQQQEMDKKAVMDAVAIQAKAEVHDKDYHERRKAMLERGVRRASIYRKDRSKEASHQPAGPSLPIIVKGDVDGSVEAILDVLDTYYSDQCRLDLVSYGVGDITQHDLELAASFNAILYAFNVKMPLTLKSSVASGVDIRHHNVIYKMFDDLKAELNDRLSPVEQEEIIGEAKVLQLFVITDGKKKVPVAGCRCTSGALLKKHKFRLLRDGEVVYDGPLSSMRHLKNEVESIKTDVECGLSLTDHNIVPEPGDVIQCYKLIQVKQEIDWDLDF